MKNKAQTSIVGVIILISVIVILVAMAWFLLLPPSCDIENQIQLQGFLYGFERNSTSIMWDVRLGNTTYQFNHWDKSYVERLIGFDVIVTCCDRGKHFDFLTAYVINEEMDENV